MRDERNRPSKGESGEKHNKIPARRQASRQRSEGEMNRGDEMSWGKRISQLIIINQPHSFIHMSSK